MFAAGVRDTSAPKGRRPTTTVNTKAPLSNASGGYQGVSSPQNNNRSVTPNKTAAPRPQGLGNILSSETASKLMESIQKNQFVNELREDELDGQLPKLKKVFLNGAEIPNWQMIKRDFALQKNLYREIDETKEEQEDFKQRDEFSHFEEVLSGKIAESQAINDKLTEKLEQLEATQKVKSNEDNDLREEIASFKSKKNVFDEENIRLENSLRNLFQAIQVQEKIREEYRRNLDSKKQDYVRAVERIEQQQDLSEKRPIMLCESEGVFGWKRLKLLNRDLSQLQEAQSELYFLYQATGRKMSNNSQFLEYIKSFRNTGNLKEIRRLLNMDDVKKPVASKPEREKRLETAPAELQESNAEGPDALNLKTFKDMLRTVIKEANGGANK